MREGGRIVSVAAIIAVAVATKGRREIIGLHLGLSKAEVFWTDLMRDVAKRRLAGVKLVISEAHEGAEKRRPPCRGRHLAEVPCALGRNALDFVPRAQATIV